MLFVFNLIPVSKLNVAGSIPVSRSIQMNPLQQPLRQSRLAKGLLPLRPVDHAPYPIAENLVKKHSNEFASVSHTAQQGEPALP